MLIAAHLTKRYGSTTALDNVSVSVAEGQVLGLLGENGAGKSTLLNILSGFMEADGGTVSVGGLPLDTGAYNAKRLLGYLPELPPLYPDMTVREYLFFCIELKEVVKAERQKHFDDIIGLSGLADVAHRRIRSLSHGYQQRLGVAQALVGAPRVLLLDEPTNGLDPAQIMEFKKLISKLSRKHTIVISSHILSLIQSVCDRIVILHKGRVLADQPVQGDAHAFCVKLAAPPGQVMPLLRGLDSARRVSLMQAGDGYTDLLVETNDAQAFPLALHRLSAGHQLPILHLVPKMDTLEEIYMRTMKGQEVGTA